MDEKVAQKWISALRSGNYKQGYGKLRVGDLFCAEGVLCDVVDPFGWKRDGFGSWAYNGVVTALPVQLAIDLSFNNVTTEKLYHPNLDGRALAHINDKERKSFTEIADIIEKYWQQL